jgi:C4-dicarboxylate-specific signal transduction histidine kinase
MYTNLMQRQLKRYLKEDTVISPDWQALLDAVNRSYEHYERDHSLAEHSLKISSQELVIASRYAGMVEVAASILHNVGNILNSISVSTQILTMRNEQNNKAEDLIKLVDLLESHRGHLEVFFQTNPAGIILPEFLKQFANYLDNEKKFIQEELKSLCTNIQHVKNIIMTQQVPGKSTEIIEEIQINNLIDDAITINSMEKYGIHIERIYQKIPNFFGDKVKLLQILVNITKNALESLVESKKKEKKITLKTTMPDPAHIHVEISDNGLGIQKEMLMKIFTYGFTTKTAGHGFGLHSSVRSMQEMGGELKVYSEGLGQGATFILILPRTISSRSEG